MLLLDYTKLNSGSCNYPANVPKQKQIWRAVLPLALLVLVIGATLSGVWHSHAISSPDACPICDLSHQASEPAQASPLEQNLVPAGPGPEPQQHRSILSPAATYIPARAPPA